MAYGLRFDRLLEMELIEIRKKFCWPGEWHFPGPAEESSAECWQRRIEEVAADPDIFPLWRLVHIAAMAREGIFQEILPDASLEGRLFVDAQIFGGDG